MIIREQGLDNLSSLIVFTDKNVNDICDFMRKQGGKNSNRMPNRGQQIAVTAQENLKLTVILFHHRVRCNLDWEVLEVHMYSASAH